MIAATVKRCYIASDGDSLAGEGVIIIPVRLGRLFNTIDRHIAIRLNVQAKYIPNSFGSGQGDDPFGEEGVARQQRAEEDEEPDA